MMKRISLLLAIVAVGGLGLLAGCSSGNSTGGPAAAATTPGSSTTATTASTAPMETPTTNTPPPPSPTPIETSSSATAVTSTPAYSGDFAIEGKWKNTGSQGFGQAQPGAIIIFDGMHCNFYSPSDTYALIHTDKGYELDLTSLIGESQAYSMTIIDTDHIEFHIGTSIVDLQRVG